ncbi:MAG: OmpA family protein [Alphaproteobacteria bacterium]|nr:OmpA family protein [Alphaproteobacteria bacterium]
MLNIRFREKTNAWPGFVDLFSNLVIILIFLLIVFLFLLTTTSVFNKNTGAKKVAALEKASQEQAEQIVQMTADNQEAEQLLVAAREALENQEEQLENQKAQTASIANAYEQQISDLNTKQTELANQISALTDELHQAVKAKEEMARMESERHEMQDEMSAKISELNNRVAELQAALDKAEETAKQQDVEYIEMSNRLNKALADKVAELNILAEYQSEFYKQIKLALGDKSSVKQDGDRFILSSDILFGSGSYKISADGKKQLQILANIIKDFEDKIPSNIDWIIRVDGHTDNKAVLPGTHAYRNNMQLSLLRATAVVDELVKNGVQRTRLIPTGFGDMHPVELGNDKASLQKNRRIELQITNR